MRFQGRFRAMNEKLGVVFEKSHKLQFHKRIEDSKLHNWLCIC